MAHIETRSLAKGKKSYIVRWREPITGERRHQVFHRYDDARSFRGDLEHKMSQGEYTPDSGRKTPFGEYAEQVLFWNLRDSTKYAYEKTYRKWIEPELGDKPIGSITTSQLRSFLAELPASDVVKRSCHRLIAKVLNKAVEDGILSRSPLKPVGRPRTVRQEILVLDPYQIREIADHADLNYRTPILLAGFCGLRAGEIGGLRVQDVDFQSNQLAIRQAVIQVGPKRQISEVKTGASRRTISFPPFIGEELMAHMSRFQPAEDGRIFTTRNGGLVSHTVLLKRLDSACKAAGAKKMRFHDLRHSCAALAIKAGAHPKTVQSFLGHSNISITMDVYGHLFPSVTQELAVKLGDMWDESSEVQSVVQRRAG